METSIGIFKNMVIMNAFGRPCNTTTSIRSSIPKGHNVIGVLESADDFTRNDCLRSTSLFWNIPPLLNPFLDRIHDRYESHTSRGQRVFDTGLYLRECLSLENLKLTELIQSICQGLWTAIELLLKGVKSNGLIIDDDPWDVQSVLLPDDVVSLQNPRFDPWEMHRFCDIFLSLMIVIYTSVGLKFYLKQKRVGRAFADILVTTICISSLGIIIYLG